MRMFLSSVKGQGGCNAAQKRTGGVGVGVMGIGGVGLVCLASRNLTPRTITATVATTKAKESTRIIIDFPEVTFSVAGDATKGTRSMDVTLSGVQRGMDGDFSKEA